ncbi:MAG TPA: molybdopterin biosynthesis protein [Clostridiales bacterium UBA8960]|nr:molybdopterin biosynthesis protein [Clostridiales bacterium UBA8960]
MNNVFIGNLPVEKAIALFHSQVELNFRREMVKLKEASGRKTAEAVIAKKSSPDFHSAAMDGIAVNSEITQTASERTPKRLFDSTDFQYINTGNPLPKGTDSVIMIEEVIPIENGVIEIMVPSYPWQHIRQIGEDIIKGEMVLPSNHVIRPLDLGALMSAGIEEVCVYSKPRLGILPTGSEIVQRLSELAHGKILDSSSGVFEAYAHQYGAAATIYAPVSDDYELLKAAVEKAVEENDIVMTIAGSSAGSKDFTVDVLSELGRIIVHGVAMKPGKPTILGEINGKPFIGLPGYPVSSFFTFDVFVRPLLTDLNPSYSSDNHERCKMEVSLTQRIVSNLKHEEYVRMQLGYIGEKLIATPLSRGAGSTMSLVKADAILVIPREVEGMESESTQIVTLISPIKTIKEKLVINGSHDLLLDFLADKMPIASTHFGSMGGIIALKKNVTHIAPVHLIDEQTGQYNKHLPNQFFKGENMTIIEGVKREQGIIVKKGNPKQITSLKDLTREDVAFVNRQRGAGTRQLLDFELSRLGIDPRDIYGYSREVTTHMAVAISVANEGADAGLGIYSAAQHMDLDFISIGFEHYDFIIRDSSLDDPRVTFFISLLKSKWFKDTLDSIGGYAIESPGTLYKAV